MGMDYQATIAPDRPYGGLFPFTYQWRVISARADRFGKSVLPWGRAKFAGPTALARCFLATGSGHKNPLDWSRPALVFFRVPPAGLRLPSFAVMSVEVIQSAHP